MPDSAAAVDIQGLKIISFLCDLPCLQTKVRTRFSHQKKRFFLFFPFSNLLARFRACGGRSPSRDGGALLASLSAAAARRSPLEEEEEGEEGEEEDGGRGPHPSCGRLRGRGGHPQPSFDGKKTEIMVPKELPPTS